MLGDSSAVGLGVRDVRHTPGAVLAGGLAALARRPVRLTVVAAVGAETRDLDAQIDRLFLRTPVPHAAVIMVGANDITHRMKPSESVRALDLAVRRLRGRGAEVVVGTCPDLGTVEPIPQPLRYLARRWSRQLAAAQTVAVVEAGGRAVSLGDLLGPEFVARPHEMFSDDRFHPWAAGYAQAAAALLPSVCAALDLLSGELAAQRPDVRTGEGLDDVAHAAARAVAEPGTEVSAPTSPATCEAPGAGGPSCSAAAAPVSRRPRPPRPRLPRRPRRPPGGDPPPPADGDATDGEPARPGAVRLPARSHPVGARWAGGLPAGRIRGTSRSCRRRSRARGRHRLHRPHRRSAGLSRGPQGRAPRRPRGHDRRRRARQGARARPAGHGGPLSSAAPSRAGEHGANMARVVAVLLGPTTCPAPRSTGSAPPRVQTTRMAFHAIKAGEGDVFVSAGVECVSRYRLRRAPAERRRRLTTRCSPPAQARTAERRRPTRRGHDPRADGALPDIYIAMGQTAENVATLAGVSRREQDESGRRAARTGPRRRIADGFFAREITPVTLPDGTVMTKDDSPRPGVTLEAVETLKPVFREDGTVTAGNCCPLNDGAAALVVMSDTKAQELGITPLARVVATGVSGLSPEIMGLGPVEASRQALARAGMTIGDMDLVEINEAFAAQVHAQSPTTSASTSTGSTCTAARSPSATRSA